MRIAQALPADLRLDRFGQSRCEIAAGQVLVGIEERERATLLGQPRERVAEGRGAEGADNVIPVPRGAGGSFWIVQSGRTVMLAVI